MKQVLLLVMIGLIGGNIYTNSTKYNEEHPLIYKAEAKETERRVVLIEAKIDWTPDRIEKEIEEQAKKYNRDAEYMKSIIACESQGSTTIQSYHRRKDGTREQSYGLAQIFLPAHPSVTKEQATDPSFAINFLAKNLGKVKWSCEDMI